jgi:hypothetical protein
VKRRAHLRALQPLLHLGVVVNRGQVVGRVALRAAAGGAALALQSIYIWVLPSYIYIYMGAAFVYLYIYIPICVWALPPFAARSDGLWGRRASLVRAFRSAPCCSRNCGVAAAAQRVNCRS